MCLLAFLFPFFFFELVQKPDGKSRVWRWPVVLFGHSYKFCKTFLSRSQECRKRVCWLSLLSWHSVMQRENHFFRFRSCKATIFDLTDSAFLMENANDNVVRRCRRKEYSESPNKYLLTGARELSLFAFRLPNQLFLVYAPCCKQLTTIYSSGELLLSCCQLSGTLFGGISCQQNDETSV